MKLKELRISKGLTQEEASKISHVSLRSYKRYENDSNYLNSLKYNVVYNAINEVNKNNKQTIHHKSYQIAVAGIGYVGLSLATLLSKDNDVTITDILTNKIEQINHRVVPFKDNDIEEYFAKHKLNLKATFSDNNAYIDKDFIIIATPTDFDNKTNAFNESSVLNVLSMINEVNQKALVIIKSTVSIGFTERVNKEFPKLNIIFSPEFLKEGHALHDNLYPTRIIIGTKRITKKVKIFASLLEKHALNYQKVIYMSPSEAEAVKLFSNAYLAMRVAYFNELDSYAKVKGLNTANIIMGMSRDNRIGDYYNNPSFGYGGYCLPKDSEQLQSSFIDIPNNNLIKAIVESNKTRKSFIVEDVIKEAIKLTHKDIKDITIGIYRLAMKSGSDNYRSSSSLDVMNELIKQGVKVIVYDLNYPHSITNLEVFKKQSDFIITNRYDLKLDDVKDKVYSRDIYKRD